MKTVSQKLQEYLVYRKGEEEGKTQEITMELSVISTVNNLQLFKIFHLGISGKGSTVPAALDDFFTNLKGDLQKEKDKAEKTFFDRSTRVETISKLCE